MSCSPLPLREAADCPVWITCNRGQGRLLKSAQRTEQLPPAQQTVTTLARKDSWKWASRVGRRLPGKEVRRNVSFPEGRTARAKARGSYGAWKPEDRLEVQRVRRPSHRLRGERQEAVLRGQAAQVRKGGSRWVPSWDAVRGYS